MKKIAYLSACVLLAFFASCTKNNDNVRAVLENALPTVEITSMGLVTQTGPFAQSDVIQVTCGGALTKSDAGVIDYAWYDGNTQVDTVHFNSWTEKALAANGNNAVTTTYIPTTYPNTIAFSSSLVMKLAKLPAGGKSFTLKVYVRTARGEVASLTQTKFITVK